MSRQTPSYSPELLNYLATDLSPEPEILTELRAHTAKMPGAQMQISADQGRFFRLLARALKVEKALEIGTFTGYSALCVALEMPPAGRLIAIDRDPKTAAIARQYWQKAGVADKIDLRLGDGLEILNALLADSKELNSFDFAFIDADKKPYRQYYEAILQLLRPGGIVALDNVFMGEDVLAPSDDSARAMAELNRFIISDPRVFAATLPLADGVTLALKL